jgi:hypothetical protein
MAKPDDLPSDSEAARWTPSALAPVAAGAAAIGLCCGVPLLASFGVVGVIAGLGVGSWIAVALASVVAAIGVLRWRRRSRCRVAAETLGNVGLPPVAVQASAPTREARQ